MSLYCGIDPIEPPSYLDIGYMPEQTKNPLNERVFYLLCCLYLCLYARLRMPFTIAFTDRGVVEPLNMNWKLLMYNFCSIKMQMTLKPIDCYSI